MEWREALQVGKDNYAVNDITETSQALVGDNRDGTYCVIVEGKIVANGCDATGVAYHLWKHGLAQADWHPS